MFKLKHNFLYALLFCRNFRRALDLKLKKLRSLLTADEDITTELDKIVCRLMKLALRTSASHQLPPPTTWMQRKFLDLLSLTEKAIQRRRKHFIENYPLNAIGYGDSDRSKNDLRKTLTLNTILNDDTADKIVDKYYMFSSEPVSEKYIVKSEIHFTEENLSITSNEMEPFSLEPKSLYGEIRLESMKSESKEQIHLEITQGWIDQEYDMLSPTNDFMIKSNVDSSVSNTSNDSQYRYEKVYQNDTGICDKNQNISAMHVNSKNNISKSRKTYNRQRHSKNKLIKKVSKKYSSSEQLVKKYSKKFGFVEYKSYTFNKPKIGLKDHNLQPTLSKPIPRSLIELCYQDLRTEKSDKLIESSLQEDISSNVAATKESFFIDIVTEDVEESFALRRGIATDVDQKSDILESEAILETVINVTKDESFDANHVVPFESVDSETIFLTDLNEPSTSKGIRHVNADVQCGPDTVYSISQTMNSTINLSNKCETGIKIGDSFTNLKFAKNSVDFGTITDGINFYSDMMVYPSNAIKIKDSDLDVIKTVECSTSTRDDSKLDKRIIMPTNNIFNTRQSIPALRVCSSNLSGLHCVKNPSANGISQRSSVTKYIKPKLSLCGTHVHSYRDRQVSEDVIFQGEWQRKGPTILVKKNPCTQLNSRKREGVIKKKKVNSKENIVCQSKQKNIITVSEKTPKYRRNVKYTKPKQEMITKDIKKLYVSNSSTKFGRKNPIPKIVSKTITSGTATRIVNNQCEVKGINSKSYSRTKYVNNREISNIKKNPTSCTSHKFNKTANYSTTPNKTMLPIISSKPRTKEVKDKLLKFTNEKREKITYLVFRNEIENSKNGIIPASHSKAVMKADSPKNSYCKASRNSSPCSSPNSIVTVRDLSVNSESYCDKSSMSPDRNNLENVLEGKNKKYTKSSRIIKVTNQSSLLCENKENLPQSSKNCKGSKDLDKFSKTLAGNRNKNVFMLQLRNESSPSIARKKSEGASKTLSSSNTKTLKNKTSDNHNRVLSACSFNKPTNNECKSPITTKDDTLRNETCKFPEVNYLTRSSTPILDKMINIEAQGFATEQDSSVKRSNSQINAAMKQLIEERLSFIKQIPVDNNSDSETVILSRDDRDNSVDDGLSPISYKTVDNSDNTCNISGRDIENALLNYTFDSDYASLANSGSTPSKLPNTDTDSPSEQLAADPDFRSFRSAVSITKLSEYVHRNELDDTLVPQQSSNSRTVRDLFERKDPTVSNNTGGVLAVQVFSGFSMDGEPAVGDRPEYTRLVDPETGNLTLEMARQTTSEELFVSGRSSDTYESCFVEDDAYLPNWLFHIINQQESVENVDEEEEPEAADQLVEAEYDINGNVVEASFGVGVGAGDGHGMHSDQSQDSSGRGTSISSSDVSSGPQSEAILIDPSAFLGANPRTEPAIGSTVVAVESSDISFRTIETTGTDNETAYDRDNVQSRLSRGAVVSDADADVSSLETDAIDSDN